MGATKPELTHLDAAGQARMVDVGAKEETARGAIAEAWVVLAPAALEAIATASLAKGDALAVARIAGIAAAKRAADLMPLCHPLRLSRVVVEAEVVPERGAVYLRAQVEALDRTGVEMEALTAATVAALNIYDMAKALDRTARIEGVRVTEKWGGRSGHFRAAAP